MKDGTRSDGGPSGLGTWLQMDDTGPDTDLDIDGVTADYDFGIRPVEFD